MLEANKQALLFNFGEDLSYFLILRYKLLDLIKGDVALRTEILKTL